jgi:hypothetical protein
MNGRLYSRLGKGLDNAYKKLNKIETICEC